MSYAVDIDATINIDTPDIIIPQTSIHQKAYEQRTHSGANNSCSNDDDDNNNNTNNSDNMQHGVINDPNGKPFPKLTNDCILRAALGEPTEFVPVWIMRQAGRYLPEFRELRKKHPFFEICESPDLACEALGMRVEMTAEGPKFPQPLKTEERPLFTCLDVDVDISQRLKYVYQAITVTRHALEGKCPLIGFCGAPWTLMCYMVEGGGSKTMSNAKKWLYQTAIRSHKLLRLLAAKVTDHLVEQARAGAQLLQLFESNAEYLNLQLFEEFAYPYISQICRDVKDRLKSHGIEGVPLLVFAKGGHYAIDLLGKSDGPPIDVLSLDWTIDPVRARKATKLCLQGNLDPCAMYTDPERIADLAKDMICKFGTQNYIANLGHGIYPDANMACVKALVDSVHEISLQANKNKQ